MLPPSLPWYTYCGVIDDLSEYIKKRVPIGYRSIVIFARNITLKSNVSLVSDYHNVPAELVIVCETLEVKTKVCINLSGQNAVDLLSFSETPGNNAWWGKPGCKGGSISIHAINLVGIGSLEIDVHGGDGGKGQDGYIGNPGGPGESVSAWYLLSPLAYGIASAATNCDGKNGENGGDGGMGGIGGDAGEIELSIWSFKISKRISVNTLGGDGGRGGFGGKGGVGGMGGTYGVGSRGARGRDGRYGRNGPRGKNGEKTKCKSLMIQEINEFYKSFPISAAYVQRALNFEIKCSVKARCKGNDSQLELIHDNIIWISSVAHRNNYDVIASLCVDSVTMCKKSEHHFRTSTVKIDTDKAKVHIEGLKHALRECVGCDSLGLHSKIQNDPMLAKHAKHVKLLNHMEGVFNRHKTRFAEATSLLETPATPWQFTSPFQGTPATLWQFQVGFAVAAGANQPTLESNVAKELNTSFSEHVNVALKNAEEKPFMTAMKQEGRMSVSSVSTEAPSEAASEAPSSVSGWISDPMEFSNDVDCPSEHVTAVEGPSESSSEYATALEGSEGASEYATAASEELPVKGSPFTRTAFEGPTQMVEGETTLGEDATVLGEGASVMGEETAFLGEGAAVAGESTLALGAETAAIVGAEAVVAPELVAVEALAIVAVAAISCLLEAQAEALTAYEAAVRARLRLMARNRARLRIDQKEPDPPERRRRKKERKSESGIYIGMLDKCERVEGNPSQVVAVFDSIHLDFTTKEDEKKVDLNELDSIQQRELREQLELQRVPFNPLPAYLIITRVSAGVVNEEAVGRWFEFNAQFMESGQSEAIEITTLNSFFKGKSLMSFSGVTKNGRPVTIESVRCLSSPLEEEVNQVLNLSGDIMGLGVPYSQMRSLSLGGGGGRPIKSQLSGSRQGVGKGVKKDIRGKNTGQARAGKGGKKEIQGKGTGQRGMAAREQRSISKVLVANVGQGSCNIFFNRSNEVKLVYDLGYGPRGCNDSALELIMTSPTIVISHWDIDHYRYLTLRPSLILGKTFIVPSFGTNRSVFLRRVYRSIQNKISYGYGSASTHAIIPCQGKIPNLELRMTVVRSGRGLNRNNFNAITACVKDSEGGPLFLLPGDASFRYVAQQQRVGPNLRYLLATHHGSTRSLIGDTQNIPIKGSGVGSIIFSYGRNNIYGHNAETAMPYYRPKGWSDYKITENTQVGIHFGLS